MFLNLITNGPSFSFGMEDITRIRKEFKILVKLVARLYYSVQKKEMEQKQAVKEQEKQEEKETLL
jgi:hypothetical protein